MDARTNRTVLISGAGVAGPRVAYWLPRHRFHPAVMEPGGGALFPHRWANRRVVLVGDAASSVSLFGGGLHLAMAGAYALVEELAAIPTDPGSAFVRYEAKHRTLVDPRLGAS